MEGFFFLEGFIQWCSDHFLEVKKTNEMVIDCSKNKISVPLSDINIDQIEMVSTHKSLGVETGNQ